MPISNIDISQVAPSASSLNQGEPALKETDGVLLVANGRSEHPLQNEHCKPCLTVFQELQLKAAEGGPESQDLLKRAQAQMEQLQSNQINTLSGKSKTPVAYAVPETKEATSVSFTSNARMRSANVARLRPDVVAEPNTSETEVQTVAKQSPAPTQKPVSIDPAVSGRSGVPSQSNDTSTEGKSTEAAEAVHASNDGHGHGGEKTPIEGNHGKKTNNETQLTEAELDEIRTLQQRDTEVRTHEQAHKSAAGSHGGSISLSFKQGPDGKRYAVEGEVPVDLSSVSDDPEATVAKMQQIQRAALAPAEPSSADRRVAAKAGQKAAKARKEIANADTNGDNPLKKEHGIEKGQEIKVEAGTAPMSEAAKDQTTQNQSAALVNGERSPLPPVESTDTQDIGAHGTPSKDDVHSVPKTHATDANERVSLSRKMPLNAYAKAKASPSQYSTTDRAARATLSMNVYG